MSISDPNLDTVCEALAAEMGRIRDAIVEVVMQRERLKGEMERWYSQSQRGSFPKRRDLERLDQALSELDSRFSRLWNAGKKCDKTEYHRQGRDMSHNGSGACITLEECAALT